jgi:hypothetical protein
VPFRACELTTCSQKCFHSPDFHAFSLAFPVVLIQVDAVEVQQVHARLLYFVALGNCLHQTLDSSNASALSLRILRCFAAHWTLIHNMLRRDANSLPSNRAFRAGPTRLVATRGFLDARTVLALSAN